MTMREGDDLAYALADLKAAAELTGPAGHENDSLMPPGERMCPICSEKMQTIRKLDIVLDVCELHGVWLDKGEFATILERTYHYRRDVESREQLQIRRGIARETNQKLVEGCWRVVRMLGC